MLVGSLSMGIILAIGTPRLVIIVSSPCDAFSKISDNAFLPQKHQ